MTMSYRVRRLTKSPSELGIDPLRRLPLKLLNKLLEHECKVFHRTQFGKCHGGYLTSRDCPTIKHQYKVAKFERAAIPAGMAVIAFVAIVSSRIVEMLYNLVDNAPDSDLLLQFLDKWLIHCGNLQ